MANEQNLIPGNKRSQSEARENQEKFVDKEKR